MKILYRFRILFLLTPLLISSSATADWLNLTGAETAKNIAEIYILDDHVRVQLEVFPGDIETFKELIPDDWTNELNLQRPTIEQRQERFANHTLSIKTGKGEILPAQFELIEPRMRIDRRSPFAGMINPYTGRRIPKGPEDKRVVYAEIIYPFDEKPRQLEFIPPLDESGLISVTIGFLAYHQSVPIIDFRYLGQAEKLKLDWEDPWYSEFINKNLTRHHKYPLMLYLYVEPRRVRLESLMRVVDVAKMVGFDSLEMENNALMHERLQERILTYFAAEGDLDIDGESVLPDSVKVNYFTVGVSGLTPVETPSKIDDRSLLVGVGQHYYIETLPEKIHSTWPYFSPQIDKFPFVETDPAGPLPGFVYKEDPVFSWKNQLKTYQEPAIQPVKADTGWSMDIPFYGKATLFSELPDESQAREIMGELFENMRIAYLEKHPLAFASALEKLTSEHSPDLLASELSKLFAPAMKRGGQGEVSRLGELKVIDIQELEASDGFRTTVSGAALVQAMHWGHSDRLQIQFQLLLDLLEEDGQWRLADLTVIDLKAE